MTVCHYVVYILLKSVQSVLNNVFTMNFIGLYNLYSTCWVLQLISSKCFTVYKNYACLCLQCSLEFVNNQVLNMTKYVFMIKIYGLFCQSSHSDYFIQLEFDQNTCLQVI